MGGFQWSDEYVIGVPEIDAQHRQLMEMVNRLGELVEQGAEQAAFDGIVHGIFNYAATHFVAEDRVWARLGVDESQLQAHTTMHDNYMRQMQRLQQQFANVQRDAAIVHSFLEGWLVYHILGEGRHMARVAGLVAEPPPAAAGQGSGLRLVLPRTQEGARHG